MVLAEFPLMLKLVETQILVDKDRLLCVGLSLPCRSFHPFMLGRCVGVVN